jgi:hypothetical protein
MDKKIKIYKAILSICLPLLNDVKELKNGDLIICIDDIPYVKNVKDNDLNNHSEILVSMEFITANKDFFRFVNSF